MSVNIAWGHDFCVGGVSGCVMTSTRVFTRGCAAGSSPGNYGNKGNHGNDSGLRYMEIPLPDRLPRAVTMVVKSGARYCCLSLTETASTDF